MSRPLRTVVYCLALLGVIVWLAVRMAPPPAPEEGERAVSAEVMAETLASLRSETAKGGRLVIVLGDSSLRWHPPLTVGETLTAMLERDADRVGATVRVIAYDGFDAVAYYLLVDEIAALRPAAVILTANLQSFVDAWFRRANMKHPQLAAFVRPIRVPQAIGLPLELAGISDAALVFDPVLRLLGASQVPEAIDGYRTRVRERLDGVTTAAAKTAWVSTGVAHAEPAPPAPPPVAPPPRRAAGAVMAKGAFRFMDLYPANLDREQSTARVMAATVRDLTARDVRTLVLIAPMHVEAARLTGAYQGRNFPQAVRVVTDLTVASGGSVIDLAEALPKESYFVDRYTHFTADGNRIVADRVLETLGALFAADAAAAD